MDDAMCEFFPRQKSPPPVQPVCVYTQTQDPMQLDELIITLFCQIDDFVKAQFPARRLRQRGPLPRLADSEVMTMEVVGEYLGLNTEKAIYQYFARHWRHFFARLPDRSNFVRQCAATGWLKRRFLDALTRAEDTFIQIIDSMPLHICEFVRAHRCRLFRGQASYGKWFGQTIYGFKLHLKLTMRVVRKLLAHALCVLLNLRLGRDPLHLKGLVA